MTVATSAADAGDTDQTIGLNVHGLLYRRKASQKELSVVLGVTPSVLSKKLRGESAWSARQVAATAAFLEIDPGRLYRELTVPRVGLKLLQGLGKSGKNSMLQPLVRSVPASLTND